jgi:hypothetical protein
MKTYRIISWLALFLVFFISGCAKDSTTDPGTTDTRSKYLGIWQVNEQWTKLYYEVTITDDNASTNGVYLANFAGSGTGVSAFATIVGNTITLNKDEYLSNGWTINGSGTLTGTTKMAWAYNWTEGSTPIFATADYTKK